VGVVAVVQLTQVLMVGVQTDLPAVQETPLQRLHLKETAAVQAVMRHQPLEMVATELHHLFQV
jgi:hypothetical protein